MRIRYALPLLLACALAALIPFAEPSPAAIEIVDFQGWPKQFEGRNLRALPLTAMELRFMSDFPGRIGRFTDGEHEIVMRWISEPTRKLHLAVDCFKGSGYSVKRLPIEVVDGRSWSTFEAQRGAERLRVREVIVDESAGRWTDVSAWYWAAILERTQRPWLAITVASTCQLCLERHPP